MGSTTKTILVLRYCLLVSLIVVGVLLRFAILSSSYGTNDVDSWYRFATSIDAYGVGPTYERDNLFNHPPLMAFFTWGAYRLAQLLALPFEYVLKLPIILADIGSIVLIAMSKAHLGKTRLLFISALYALSPIALLISGYHGNTDPIYTMLVLAGFLSLLSTRPILAGICFGCACSVKLIPLIVVPACMLYAYRHQSIRLFALSFIVVLVTLYSPLVIFGLPAVHNIFLYSSFESYWGVPALLTLAGLALGEHGEWVEKVVVFYRDIGRWIIILAATAALVALRRRWQDLSGTLTVSYLAFAIFAPGFAVQYLVLGVALFFLSLPWRYGFTLGVLSGLMALTSYAHFLVSTSPFKSVHYASDPKLVVFFGFLTWVVLVWGAVRLLFPVSSEQGR